jgi:hypothetical protein
MRVLPLGHVFSMSYDPKIRALRVDLPTQETNPGQLVLLSFQNSTRFDTESKLGFSFYVYTPSTKVTWQNSLSEPSWERRRYNDGQFNEKLLILERIFCFRKEPGIGKTHALPPLGSEKSGNAMPMIAKELQFVNLGPGRT